MCKGGGRGADHPLPLFALVRPRSYLVLPFCKWTLKSYFEPLIAARVAGGSQLVEEREVLLLLLQLCRALTHLQRHHVVHRDMKVL